MRVLFALLLAGSSAILANRWDPEADIYQRDFDDYDLQVRDFDLEGRNWDDNLVVRESEANELETRIHCSCRRSGEQQGPRLPPGFASTIRAPSGCSCFRRRDLEAWLETRNPEADPFWLTDIFKPKDKKKEHKDHSLKDDEGSGGGDDDGDDSSDSSDTSSFASGESETDDAGGDTGSDDSSD